MHTFNFSSKHYHFSFVRVSSRPIGLISTFLIWIKSALPIPYMSRKSRKSDDCRWCDNLDKMHLSLDFNVFILISWDRKQPIIHKCMAIQKLHDFFSKKEPPWINENMSLFLLEECHQPQFEWLIKRSFGCDLSFPIIFWRKRVQNIIAAIVYPPPLFFLLNRGYNILCREMLDPTTLFNSQWREMF